MKKLVVVLLSLAVLCGCGRREEQTGLIKPAGGAPQAQQPDSLVAAKQGFVSNLTRRESAHEPVPQPPAGTFNVVQYDSPAGKMAAYLSIVPQDGKRRPAIIWITGGDCNTIGDVWSPAPADNDQTAGAFREAGIITMYPSMRGGNENPGVKEGFLGEVDDVLAAADFLAKQEGVEPSRIYLGGHSTGGTLAMLVAETAPRFRAVFAFGPAASPVGYPAEFLPFSVVNQHELAVRSPIMWLHCIKCPVFVIEGTVDGNLDSLQAMAQNSKNPMIRFHPVPQANHFSVLAPATRLVAQKILHDEGPEANIAFSEEELGRLMSK